MAQPNIQTSFNAGEWAPALGARVDLAKYHNGAALLRNFFVDYRGGASTCVGTKYILQAYKSSTAVRLIGFQASSAVSYILEFGDLYLRFYNNGAPVLETANNITGATLANPCVLSVVNTYSPNDWVYITGVVGMTQLNGKYFQLSAATGTTITLSNLNGVAINSTGYTAYASGGTVARVYTIASPYAAADLALLKFAQNVNTLVLCHPSYKAYVLTLVAATNWTLIPIIFGATINAPTSVSVATTLAAGSSNYAYVVTSIDANGQESIPSASAIKAAIQDLRQTAGSNNITWTGATGAQSYNVYKAEIAYGSAVPGGAAFGFIGNCTQTTLVDSNIAPDFTTSPPVAQNPFQGGGVASANVTTAGTYTVVPSVTFAAAPSGGQTATGNAVLQIVSFTLVAGGGPFSIGQSILFPNGIVLIVATVDGTGAITAFQPLTYPGTNKGTIASGSTPTNPVTSTTGPHAATANFTWGVGIISMTSGGAGYLATPAITFSSGAAVAVAVLSSTTGGNPSVPAYFQQRLVLAGSTTAPQTFYMSQPGNYYNYNISQPIQDDNAITGSIVSGQLNSIKSMISMQSGLIIMSSKAAWQVSGGSVGAAITPANATAQTQSYNGASDLPLIVSNYDVIYVQSKGSIVRDLSYNFYANIWTGSDITVLSSHLFYGYTLLEWAFAEEPFKLIWAVRNDGVLLSLTFLKEQELIGWAHRDTNGLFKSIATVTEATATAGNIDAVYVVAQRVINGNTVQYIERMAERIFPNGAKDAWCVDAGLQYNGTPTTALTGAEHLAGATVTGLADGIVIPPFVMPTTGNFTITTAASKVTIGLAFTPQLQTLPLDLGEPTVQGKMKVIPQVTLRCQDTLGLSIGRTFSTLVNMKDLTVGNVGSMTNAVVADIVTGDAKTIIDASWTVPGQYCVQQSNPLPATILGVIPQIVIGDTQK